MKLDSLMPTQKAMSVLCGIALFAGLGAFRAQADEWNKKTIFTTNQPIQVKETLLEPGRYVFKLLDSQSDRNVVQIFNGDETHIIATVLAIPAYRVNPTSNTTFTFWETPPGTASAMRKWFYPGDNFGQEFTYPKHLQELAMLEPPAPAVAPPAETAQAEPAPAPTPAPAPQPEAQPEQPVETAQAAPPPAETQAAPQPSPAEQLPKTGSPYPLIGLSGMILLGFWGVLRVSRSS